MTLQRVYGATVVVFVFGVVAVGPAYAQRRDGGLLPQEQEGQVTAVGCLLRGSAVRGGKKDKDKYVLARPRRGPFPAYQRQRARPTPVPMPWTSITRTKPA